MKIIAKTTAVLAASLFFVGSAALPSQAANQNQGDGLIQVQVGDITITDAVDVGVAAAIAANICGVDVGPVAVLGEAVDNTGGKRVICRTEEGNVKLVQNR